MTKTSNIKQLIQYMEKLRNEILFQEVEGQRQSIDIKIYKKYKKLKKEIEHVKHDIQDPKTTK